MNDTSNEEPVSQTALDIIEIMNVNLANFHTAYQTRSVSAKEFYKRFMILVVNKYGKLASQKKVERDETGVFIAKSVLRMFLDNISKRDMHKVKRYVCRRNENGRTDFYCEFN